MRTYRFSGMVLGFQDQDGTFGQCVFQPESPAASDESLAWTAVPPFQLAVADRPHGITYSLVSGNSFLPRESRLISCSESLDALSLRYRHDGTGLEVDVEIRHPFDGRVLRQTSRVRNASDREVVLTHFSSTCFQGIGTGGVLPWWHPEKIRVHLCRMAGQGENQWRSWSLEDLGLVPTCVHGTPAAIQLVSVGSRSTGQHMPLVVIEDRETDECWYLQLETSTHWMIEIGNRGAGLDPRASLFLHATVSAERQTGFHRTLRPDEAFESLPVAFGTCRGGFEEAVRELTAYRRACLKAPCPTGPLRPVVFNDFMNCLWAEPDPGTLSVLVDRAADAGCEVFCMDAGWFHPKGANLNDFLGDWSPDATRYGPDGFQAIVDRIRRRGMIPGIWLEVEVCGAASRLAAQAPEDWFLHRNGARIQDNPRQFLDLRHPDVRRHLHGVIDGLVGMGFGYLKNDFNGCVSLGDDTLPGQSPASSRIDEMRALYGFFEEVAARHPSLVLENCGSGAMRQDYGLLSRFHLQSSSDQEVYTLYPSILQGALACLLPEQCANWSYPRPLLMRSRADFERKGAAALPYEGPEQTVFTLLNGLCGLLMLSGRLDACSTDDLRLVAEAVDLYKRLRGFIARSFPSWPLGMRRIADRESFLCQALASEDGRERLLYVWRREGPETVCRVPLPQDAGLRPAAAEVLFPTSTVRPRRISLDGASLAVELPDPNTAVLVRVRFG